jgi:outer membrane protein assembly factor BamB
VLRVSQADQLGLASLPGKLTRSDDGDWAILKKKSLPGAGSWTHQYGDSGNSANSHDTLSGAARTDQLAAQWFGPPGADFGLDRNPRMPAPLAVSGRLYHQGMNRMVAVDSFNGTVLWSLEIPDLRRVNLPRDASNWCADNERLYAAILDRCWIVDGATGEVERTLQLPQASWRETHHWGYIGQADSILFGSSTKKGSAYTDFWGGESWYDKTSGYGTGKVCSDDLFALEEEGVQLRWRYQRGVILNATIGSAPGRIYFVESRNQQVRASATGRIESDALWQDQFLVALEAETGRVLWEKAIDTVDGIVVFYLSCDENSVVIASSAAGKYHLYCYDSREGRLRWENSHAWPSDNHGGHMQHPVMVAGRVFLEPCGYDLATGERFTSSVGRHEGCTTYTGTANALIYRGQSRRISMWDFEKGQITSWYNLRPSCWLSTIAADGMVLAPEAGGGCSCGNWLETSVSFSPVLGDWPPLAPGRKPIHIRPKRTTQAGATPSASEHDWPTYRHDNRRSGVTPAALAFPLKLAWTYTSPAPPRAAWTGPAKWDSYANLRDLKPMRNFDPVFHVTSVGDSLFFGSSVDNAARCLEAKTGQVKWNFFTEGPVRLPPSWHRGKVYFGSDDGYAYCVEAATGDLVWKCNPAGENRLVAHEGRMISFWPCRTGVLVEDNRAYFGASLFPWRESFLCAVDAETGLDAGPGLYRQTHEYVTMQGALLGSPTKLYSPQGRQRPEVFRRENGESLGGVGKSGDGGVYALLTKDFSTLLHGHGQNHGRLGELRGYNAETRDFLVTFPAATCLVVTEETAYLQSLSELGAFDRRRYLALSKRQIDLTAQLNQLKERLKKLGDRADGPEGAEIKEELASLQSQLAPLPEQMASCFLWQRDSELPHAMVLADTTLVCGGTDRVAAFRGSDGQEVWQTALDGKALGLAVANGRLFVSTDVGKIFCFEPSGGFRN